MRRASVVLHALFRMRRYGLPTPQLPVVGRALRACGVPFAAALLACVPAQLLGSNPQRLWPTVDRIFSLKTCAAHITHEGYLAALLINAHGELDEMGRELRRAFLFSPIEASVCASRSSEEDICTHDSTPRASRSSRAAASGVGASSFGDLLTHLLHQLFVPRGTQV
jgi:hypothetical protein